MNYQIIANLKSPMIISENRQSDISESLSYMPGSTLRGAVAAKYLLDDGSPDDKQFRDLFVENPVFFPNLFPADYNTSYITKVIPLTTVSCKRHDGFIKKEEEPSHGVYDILAEKIIEQNYPHIYIPKTCPECNNDMKVYSGFWNGNIHSPKKISSKMIFQRHTGIDRLTGTIADKIFYTTQAVADFYKKDNEKKYEPQNLIGEISLTNPQYENLKSIIDEKYFFAGADRTSGMGEFNLSLKKQQHVQVDINKWNTSFKDKLKSVIRDQIEENEIFNNKIENEQIRNQIEEKLLSQGLYFTVNLNSHTILADRFLRPTAELELSFENIPSNEIQTVIKVARSQTIRGWNSAWGMPKSDDIAVSMGSVYLFKYTGNNLDLLDNELSRLISKGIGLRKEEGFGNISICDDLHIEKEVI
ncbi:CRISPR-associated RAMP protein, family [Candidatus Magnetomorum sp. HK-1]|nr:CRISPR-associated RAMP protein, family [Candidatus Magnetomorum sp. HK-1]